MFKVFLPRFDQFLAQSKKDQYRLVQIAQSEKLKIVLLRGHFLKKFRRCPLFALQEQLKYRKENSMEHTKAYQEFKKNGNTKFVRYSEGAEMYHMSVSKFMQMANDAKAIYKLGQ